MPTLVTKEIRLAPEQDAELKELARKNGTTEDAVILAAIERELAQARHGDAARQAWEEEKAFIRSRMNLKVEGDVPQDRGWTRDDLYEERLNRYGRTRDR